MIQVHFATLLKSVAPALMLLIKPACQPRTHCAIPCLKTSFSTFLHQPSATPCMSPSWTRARFKALSSFLTEALVKAISLSLASPSHPSPRDWPGLHSRDADGVRLPSLDSGGAAREATESPTEVLLPRTSVLSPMEPRAAGYGHLVLTMDICHRRTRTARSPCSTCHHRALIQRTAMEWSATASLSRWRASDWACSETSCWAKVTSTSGQGLG